VPGTSSGRDFAPRPGTDRRYADDITYIMTGKYGPASRQSAGRPCTMGVRIGSQGFNSGLTEARV